MSLIGLIIGLIIIGVTLYLIGLIPMDPKILMAIRAVVLLIVILWVVQAFGLINLRTPVIK